MTSLEEEIINDLTKFSSKPHLPFNGYSKSKARKFGECERKEALYLKVANKIIKKKLLQGIHLKVYHCKHCDMWHLTSKLNRNQY